MSSVTVSLLEPGGERAWDDFVKSSSDGTFFHLSGWRSVIERAFKHKTFYLCAHRLGALVGVLPLTHVKSLLFGSSLISNAFCVYGGAIASDEEVQRELDAAAISIAKERNVGCIEYRSRKPAHPDWYQKSDLYATFRKPLDQDPEVNLKAIPRKQRAMVRKGISNGLKSVVDDDLVRLYDVYSQSVRNLGSPVFSKRYFYLLKQEFADCCDVVTILSGERPVASVMNFYFRDEVLPYYGGGIGDARSLAANDFMYWEVMRRACEKGLKMFDFGRSKCGTGAYHFKKNWGFDPSALCYEFLPIAKQEIPDINPLNPKYRALIAIWKRLPLPVTRVLGPSIVRGIG